MNEKLNAEIDREVRFFFEERFPDDWSYRERKQDAIRMFEDRLDYSIILKGEEPEDLEIAIQLMGRRYEAAHAEFSKYKAEFLTKLGPEIDI